MSQLETVPTYSAGSKFVLVAGGFQVNLLDTMRKDGVAFYRQVTEQGQGGGFVAETSYVPPHIPIPFDAIVYENTRVFDHADLAGASHRVSGNVSRVSEVIRPEDLHLVRMAKRKREELHALIHQQNSRVIPLHPYDLGGGPINFKLNV